MKNLLGCRVIGKATGEEVGTLVGLLYAPRWVECRRQQTGEEPNLDGWDRDYPGWLFKPLCHVLYDELTPPLTLDEYMSHTGSAAGYEQWVNLYSEMIVPYDAIEIKNA
jgi:hypothetical protein